GGAVVLWRFVELEVRQRIGLRGVVSESMPYQIVFDLDAAGYRQWWFPAIGLGVVAVGAVLVRYREPLVPRKPPWLRRIGPMLVLAFAILWTTGAFLVTYLPYLSLASALRSGRAQVVQGPVMDFTPLPPTGKGNESFVVSGRRFSYSDYNLTAGFNNTASHGGPMRNGLLVRVTHADGAIVRLEIAR